MADLLHGEDIAKLLRSEGPIVKCVLLRATPRDDDDRKQSAKKETKQADSGEEDDKEKRLALLSPLVEEIQVDTTPKKCMVEEVLGGPFTFLGQYEDEGIVLMVRRPTDDDDDGNSIPPLNPHPLQPPFDQTPVRGDILIMKVAHSDDNDDAEEQKQPGEEGQATKKVEVPSNEEFFLNYTKPEYMAFAARSDIVAPPEPEQDEEEDEEEEEVDADNVQGDDDEEDEEYNIEDEEDVDSEDENSQVAMMNLIMGQVLRRFHEENGRGPDTRELLELRSALALKMGIEMPEIEEHEADWDQKAIKKKREVIEQPDADAKSPVKPILTRKRTISMDSDDNDETEQEAKRVKFSQEDIENAKEDDVPAEEEAKKMEATEAVEGQT